MAGTDAVVGRISLTGELGYEITVPAAQQRALLAALREAGEPLGMRLIGDRAIDSLRLEKGYGIWSTEFTQAYTPAMSGLDRVRGLRQAGLHRARRGARRTRVRTRSVVSPCCRSTRPTPTRPATRAIWLDGRLVGFTTSGAYGHHVGAEPRARLRRHRTCRGRGSRVGPDSHGRRRR